MWNLLTEDGIYCSCLKWIFSSKKNFIKTPMSIYGITE